MNKAAQIFQSTRPAWGATRKEVQNSHICIFQSTRPAWGATSCIDALACPPSISIHTPRVGRDQTLRSNVTATRHFNPHAPRGARPDATIQCDSYTAFQSTRPAWGATIGDWESYNYYMISIHTPRVGRDAAAGAEKQSSLNFNPHAPRGARLFDPPHLMHAGPFQSTRPAWGATDTEAITRRMALISIHTPRVGRDRLGRLAEKPQAHFNPHAPRGARRPRHGGTRHK